VIKDPEILVLDVETTGLKPELGALPFLIGAETGNGKVYKIDLCNARGLVPDILGKNCRELKMIRRKVESSDVVKVAHNAKFEIRMFKALGWKPAGTWWCTMNMMVMLDEYSKLGLDVLADRFWDEQYEEDQCIRSWLSAEKRKRRKAYRDKGWDPDDAEEPGYHDFYERSGMPEIMSAYLEKDLDYTLRLCLMTKDRIFEEFSVPFDTDTDLVPHVADMEDAGIRVDRAVCIRMMRKYFKLARKWREKLFDIAGRRFNPNSPQQLLEVFDEQGYEITNTRKNTLFEQKGRLPKALLEYRADVKLARWFKTFLENAVGELDLLHASFWQNGQNEGIKTGRFSITDPGLQTLPGGYRGTVGDRGKDVRRAIVPRPGHNLFMVDYAQVEPRILANYTKDERMLAALNRGDDIYLAFVKIFFGKLPFKKGQEFLLVQRRSDSKTIILAITYGMGVDKMARSLGVASTVARGMKAKAMREMPTMRELMDDCMRDIVRQGYVDDLVGRRYRVPASRSYKGINAIIQGLAAQVMKRALIAVGEEIRKHNRKHKQSRSKTRARMLLTLHDEIVFEVPIGQEDELVPKIVKVMESVMPELDVPLVVDASWGPFGDSWGDKEDWSVGASKRKRTKKTKTPGGQVRAIVGQIAN
jgi:DNA polymerase-1